VRWAEWGLVADGGAVDGTAGRARTAGARVLSGDWATIAAQRNAAIAVARHEWVLAVDADERVGPELAREIAAVVAAPAHEAYAARRRNVYLGRTITHAGWGSDWVVRVFRRTSRFVWRWGRRSGGPGPRRCGFAARSVFLKSARLYELRQRVDA